MTITQERLSPPRTKGTCSDCQASLVPSHVWGSLTPQERDYWSRRRIVRTGCRGLCKRCLTSRERGGQELPPSDAWSMERWLSEWRAFEVDLSKTLPENRRAFASIHGKNPLTVTTTLKSLGIRQHNWKDSRDGR